MDGAWLMYDEVDAMKKYNIEVAFDGCEIEL
jgi:hypothetical protein